MEKKQNVRTKDRNKFFSPYMADIYSSLLLSVVNVSTDLYFVVLIRKLIGAAILKEPHNLLFIAITLIVVITLGFLTRYITKKLTVRVTSSVVKDIREQSIYHLERMKMRDIEGSYASEFMSRFNLSIASVESFLESHLHEVLYHPLLLITCLIWMARLDGRLLVLNLIAVVVITVLSGIVVSSFGKNSKEVQECNIKENRIIQDILNGIAVIKSYNLYSFFTNRFGTLQKEKLRKELAMDRKLSILIGLQMIMMILSFTICSIYGGLMAINSSLEIDKFIVFLFLMQYSSKSMGTLPILLGQNKVFQDALKQVTDIFTWETEREGGSSGEDNKGYVADKYVVEFKEVSFSYADNTEVFRKLTFIIKQNKLTVILGPSGCGKSTIFKLICGLYESSEGQINLFGKDLSQWNLSELRKNIAVVPQNIGIVSGSIAENISCGKDCSFSQVKESAIVANAHEFIKRLPAGYDTVIGSEGLHLSVGQAQRIGIARAVCKNTPLVLLDEPASSIDMKSEALINEALKKVAKNRSVVVISHRSGAIEHADCTIDLKDIQLKPKESHAYQGGDVVYE